MKIAASRKILKHKILIKQLTKPWRLENSGKIAAGKIFFLVYSRFMRNDYFLDFFKMKSSVGKFGIYHHDDGRIEKREFLVCAPVCIFWVVVIMVCYKLCQVSFIIHKMLYEDRYFQYFCDIGRCKHINH